MQVQFVVPTNQASAWHWCGWPYTPHHVPTRVSCSMLTAFWIDNSRSTPCNVDSGPCTTGEHCMVSAGLLAHGTVRHHGDQALDGPTCIMLSTCASHSRPVLPVCQALVTPPVRCGCCVITLHARADSARGCGRADAAARVCTMAQTHMSVSQGVILGVTSYEVILSLFMDPQTC